MTRKDDADKELPRKDSNLETMLKFKAAYDLHTIAEDVRAKKAAQENELFQKMIKKIDFEDYCGYMEKILYPKYLYQKEKGGRNYLIAMIIITSAIVGAFTIFPIVIQTILSATLIYTMALVFMYKIFLGVYSSYKDVWKDGDFENSDQAFSQLVKDANVKSTGVGYEVYRTMTIPRVNAELQKQLSRKIY